MAFEAQHLAVDETDALLFQRMGYWTRSRAEIGGGCTREYLHAPRATVSGVAMQVGFKDPSHLSRPFHRAFGLPERISSPGADRILIRRESLCPGPEGNDVHCGWP